MSKGEIILTALMAYVGIRLMIRFSIPMLIEWLDTISIDETTEGSEDHDV